VQGLCVLIRKDGEAIDLEEIACMAAGCTEAGDPAPVIQVFGNLGLALHGILAKERLRCFYENNEVLVLCDAEIYFVSGMQGPITSESQTIAELYQKFGMAWWEKVHGVFGAFIWDKVRSEGFAFSDRIGVKPLVYAEVDGRLAVASRIRAITSVSRFSARINPQAIHSFFHMAMVPTPFAIFEGIQKLEGGYSLKVGKQGFSLKKAWTMHWHNEKLEDQKAVETKTRSLLMDAIRIQSKYGNSIVEVGAFLSGGTDSSTITGLLSKLYPGEVKTFSIGFAESGYDEMEYARIAAKAFQTKHTEYYVTPDDVLAALPKIARAYDEPFGNSSAIPTYFCSAIAASHGVKVLLGGDGGDEIFGGNSRYAEIFQNPASRIPPWLASSLLKPSFKAIPRFAKGRLLRRIENYVGRSSSPLHEKIHQFGLSSYLDDREIFEAEFLGGRVFHSAQDYSKQYMLDSGTLDELDQFLFNDWKLVLMDNDLRKVGAMSELAGIKVRYPFLDHALVEFTGLIPAHMKVRGERLRYVFKAAFKDLLPKQIIEKQKHGFGLPVVRWMMRKGKLNDFLRETVFSSKLAERGILRKSFVEELYRRSGEDATAYYGTYLFYILILELWMKEHMD
jgi:asparagine synthase (glutamine-hydrolysing)